MRVTIFLFCLSLFLFANKGKAQSHSDGFTVKMDGYIVNLGGKKLFQPCEDSTKAIWESLDNRAFTLWYDDINDLYLEAIDNIGDSVTVEVYDSIAKKKYYERMSFFHCSLEVIMFFLDTRNFNVHKTPIEEVYYNQKKYSFSYFSIDNRVKKIIPKDKNNLMMMYEYYINKGYNAPTWLSKIVSGNAAK